MRLHKDILGRAVHKTRFLMKQLQMFSLAAPQNNVPKRYAILVLFQLQCFNDIEMQGFEEQVIC